jgi:hypothetical protein
MQACHDSAPDTQRFFAIAPYEPNATGVLEPACLDECPLGAQDGQHCRISRHDWRKRKTGPKHPLRVLRCRTHRRFFTVYPPGYVPYARKPLVRVAPDGGALRGPAKGEPERFEGTLFDAARDAARGIAWRREGGTDHEWSAEKRRMVRVSSCAQGPVWSTQGRHIGRARQLLGLGPASQKDAQFVRAELLGLEVTTLHEVQAEIGTGYRSRGQAVCRVLSATGPQGQDDRLAEAGFEAGLWGAPFRWDPRAKLLRRTPFRGTQPRPTARGPPPIRGDP